MNYIEILVRRTIFCWTFLFFNARISIGNSSALTALLCSRIPGLTEGQREMCRTSPDAIAAVGDGVRMAQTECQRVFEKHRWNCTAIGRPNTFIQVVVIGSKEAAFVYGVWSAGVSYAVTLACSRGSIAACGCVPGRTGRSTRSGWKWGGCSPDVGYGTRFARKFLDERELEKDARSLMNLHNNRVGRKIVKTSLEMECKCHGVSGSCTLRTCWERLPPFRAVAETLYQKYTKARMVMAVTSRNTKTRSTRLKALRLVLRRVRSERTQLSSKEIVPRRGDFVFLENSPNYCDRDLAAGSYGTQSRYCNRTSRDTDSCDMMCCGRGYNTHQITKIWQCRCRFQWCCSVSCDTCSQKTEEYTCK